MGSISKEAPSRAAPGRSMPFSTARRKRHSTTGWMAVHCSLITAWMRLFSSSMLRFTAIAKSGRIWSRCGVNAMLSDPAFGETSLRLPMIASW